ncbi:UNVERIFIED_CONTAM: hypothetical protein Slati_3230200 [Sesamum latifolium]|uniref:DUF3511 domain protein n=1 Tax=Sesamum latifolium TaxID=2727402 RepID=A0AAW2UZG5_9LAMI
MEGFDNYRGGRNSKMTIRAAAESGAESQISTYRDFNPKGRPVARPWYSSGELKRRKRIAEYKLYSVEGKMKNRLRKGFRWVKKTCSRIVHGF